MAWFKESEGCSFENGVLTLRNGVKIEGLDKLGMSNDGAKVSTESFGGSLYILSKNGGEDLDVLFTILEDGKYFCTPVKELNSLLFNVASWHNYGCKYEDLFSHKLDCSLDTVGLTKGAPKYKAVFTSEGMYQQKPRTYYVKGKIDATSCKDSIKLIPILNKVLLEAFSIVAEVPEAQYTLAEYEDCFVLNHFFYPEDYIVEDVYEIPRMSYKLDKTTFEVVGVDLGWRNNRWVCYEVPNSSCYALGYQDPDLVLPKELQLLVKQGVVKVFSEIAVFSAELGVPIHYFETVKAGGCDAIPFFLSYDKEFWGNTYDDVKSVYIATSPMCKETGFSRDENGLKGLLGSNAVCIAW